MNFKDAFRAKPAGFTKHFYQYKSHIFRKGLLYKTFTLKQLESVNVRPSLDERALFLDIYEANVKPNDDSSDEDVE
jgi:transcription elongation factor